MVTGENAADSYFKIWFLLPRKQEKPSFEIQSFHKEAERFSSRGNASDLHSGGARFESRPGYEFVAMLSILRLYSVDDSARSEAGIVGSNPTKGMDV
jgi:hypothetical protein